MPASSDPRSLPLRPPIFHILLALAGDDLHGLGIADEVERASEGHIQLGPGTLYRCLSEMPKAGLIEQVAAPDEDADPRRKYYRITQAGRRLLAAETGRLARLVEEARARDGLADLA